MSGDHAALLLSLLLATLLALLVYLLCLPGLSELLKRTVKVSGGIEFFTRAFQLVLFFGAIGAALTATLNVKPSEHFMEYVWDVASIVGSTLQEIVIVLIVYAVLLTILIAAVKPKDEQ